MLKKMYGSHSVDIINATSSIECESSFTRESYLKTSFIIKMHYVIILKIINSINK